MKSFLRQNGLRLATAFGVALLVCLGLVDPLVGGIVCAATFPAKGRSITVKRGAGPTLIAGVRTKSMTINGTPIDITNDDDLGIRKYMDEPGELTMSITVSGVTKDDTLRTEALSTSDRVAATEFGFPGATPGKIAGNFFLSSYTETGEYQGVSTFEATFESAGALTYTPTA